MKKILFALTIIAVVLSGCSQTQKKAESVDIKKELVKHNEQVINIFEYIRGKEDGTLLIDSIADKFNLNFELFEAKPTETVKQFRNIKDIDDITIVTFLNFLSESDTLDMVSYVVQTVGKEKYSRFVSYHNTLDSIYKNDTAYYHHKNLKCWVTKNTDRYIYVFNPTAENDTLYISVPVMPLDADKLKAMESTL